MKWFNAFYADLALPFGMKSSGIWERYASITELALKRAGVRHLIHYVNDFWSVVHQTQQSAPEQWRSL